MIVISTFHLVIQHGPVNFKHVDEDGVGVNTRVPFVWGTLVKIGIPSLLHLPKHKKNCKNAIWHMEIPGESRNPLRWTLKSGDMGVSRPTQPHTDTHTERNAATTRSHVRDDLCSAPAPTPPTPPPRACTSNGGGMEKQSRATRQTNTATDVLSSSIQQPHQRAIQIMQRAVPRRGGARENRWGSKQEQPVFKNSPIRSLISGCCARIRGLRTACGSVCADH